MKTYLLHSPQPCIPSPFGFSARKALVTLSLAFAVCAVYGQSARTVSDRALGRNDAGEVSAPDSWSAGPTLPTAMVRAAGVYFPANGLFYAMGGRSADTAGSDLTHPYEFNPTTNTWAIKTGTYPDNQVNNMACGVLTVAGTPQIYCVGGSAAGGTTGASRVFSYNPATDSVTTLTAADNWPGNTGTILPGGFAVAGNKLYIIGGFNIGTASTAQTWQFDPTAVVGSRWLQRQNYPVLRSYVPAATIGGFIYTGGGASIVTTTVTDTADSFKYDPVANTWTAITNIPRVTGETRAVAINNRMWVLGGGRVAPNPSTQVNIYDPASNSWTTGQPFVTPRRNFPTDTDGSRLWLGGGYTTDGVTPLNTMEIFTVPVAQSAVSRKTHGAAGTFDINLPLTGSAGIECRSTGGAHTIIVDFAPAVTVTVAGASVTSGTGSVGSFSASGSQVTVNLTGVANAQRITVTLSGVNNGTTTGDVPVSMGVLAGDTNGNGSVSSTDVSQVKAAASTGIVNGSTFRSDLNVSGSITATDVALVKANSGQMLPP